MKAKVDATDEKADEQPVDLKMPEAQPASSLPPADFRQNFEEELVKRNNAEVVDVPSDEFDGL